MPNIQVLDTETTGLDCSVDRLVELASIPLDSDGYFSSLCNPGRSIPPEVMAIHHITAEDAQPFPSPMSVTHKWVTSLGEPDILVAHNAKFDRGFMEPLLGAIRPQWICTYRCAVALWPEAPKHSNQVLRYWLGLKPDPSLLGGLAPHRALYDIVVTREIVRAMLTLKPLEQLLEWSNNPQVLRLVTFGKHKGKAWSEVDRGYLRWCLSQSDMDEDVAYTARYWMDRS